MSDSDVEHSPNAERAVKLQMEDFAWESIEAESARLGVSIEELVSFSVLYYLADLDSGRLARRITGSPYPHDPHTR